MAQSNWQKLDPNHLPETSGVYAFLWRRQWLYLGKSVNLKRSLESDPWPFKIAKSLDDAELLWMPSEDCDRLESKLKAMVRYKWQGFAERAKSPNCLQCDLPLPSGFEARPMLARSLAHMF